MSENPSREHFARRLREVLQPSAAEQLRVERNFVLLTREADSRNQSQTNAAFSEKWGKYEHSQEKERLYERSRRWYLDLYGFSSEAALAEYLRGRSVIFDAGCGLGYKAAWFAELATESLVIGVDYSDAALQAARTYEHLPNLFFMQGDIAATPFLEGSVPYVSCDQVIMHTQRPDDTFAELTRVTAAGGGEFACYFYAKKALPRELLDQHFREYCTDLTQQQMWEMSEQLAELGKRLSALNVQFDAPDIPALGIKGGRYDIQRFLYWNFLKCFWNEDLGWDTSVVTNFDWYSPSNARRYSEQEVREIVARNGLQIAYWHSEEACYSGRFVK
jgi:ubiquinone/menaquinone biosynthesis C-methylase UbiE